MAKPVGPKIPKLDTKPRPEVLIRDDLRQQIYNMIVRWEMWKCQ